MRGQYKPLDALLPNITCSPTNAKSMGDQNKGWNKKVFHAITYPHPSPFTFSLPIVTKSPAILRQLRHPFFLFSSFPYSQFSFGVPPSNHHRQSYSRNISEYHVRCTSGWFSFNVSFGRRSPVFVDFAVFQRVTFKTMSSIRCNSRTKVLLEMSQNTSLFLCQFSKQPSECKPGHGRGYTADRRVEYKCSIIRGVYSYPAWFMKACWWLPSSPPVTKWYPARCHQESCWRHVYDGFGKWVHSKID